ncbi:hypothetical protein OJ997_11930 [Solirubrobacter phytolaccae]|uniref:Uncharacterized protein n=1 Tax=Solirubrobacter phytolaccae TaxID=1404360 RepID=A0A9X3SF53_9ACTN|nr:hypothetical protein [Solirubrobacter phytolaccae]MDA0181007.1 hypothetical protein [Solirubrobacter phytolaccae]
MNADRRDTILVVIALLGALLSFWIPMPWGAIPAAITLLIAGAALIRSRRARDR